VSLNTVQRGYYTVLRTLQESDHAGILLRLWTGTGSIMPRDDNGDTVWR
jgi:hypothetical protein